MLMADQKTNAERDDPDAIGFLIADVARLLRAEFDQRMRHAGLDLRLADACTLVNAAYAGPVKQAALAECMGVDVMTLSNNVDRLEKRRLLRRVTDRSDRRAKLVHVADEAQVVLREIARISAELSEDMASNVEPVQFDGMVAVLLGLRDASIAKRRQSAHR